MPGAGFYAIHTDTITFAKDGRWYADGEPVEHERLALLFSRHLRRKPDGGFEIFIDERFRADVEVEDTPFVVTRIETDDHGDVTLHLNDGNSERLDPTWLATSAEDVLYCRLANGEEARFLRTAYMHLAPWLDEDPPGRFVLRLGSTAYPIRRRD